MTLKPLKRPTEEPPTVVTASSLATLQAPDTWRYGVRSLEHPERAPRPYTYVWRRQHSSAAREFGRCHAVSGGALVIYALGRSPVGKRERYEYADAAAAVADGWLVDQ